MLTLLIPSKTSSNLERLLDSIQSNKSSGKFKIVVGDNGLQKFPRSPGISISVTKVSNPFVFAKAINLCAKMADSASDLVILNDDVSILSDGFIDGFERALEVAKKNNFGILSPVVVGGVGNDDQRKDINPNLIEITKQPICFVCAAIPREVWNTIGPLDENYTGYGFEDCDYSRRVVEAGYKLGVTGAVKVQHGTEDQIWSGTFSKRFASDRLRTMFEKSHKVFIDKWGEGPQLGAYEIEETKFPDYEIQPESPPEVGTEWTKHPSDWPTTSRLSREDLHAAAPAPDEALAFGKDQDIESDTDLLWSIVRLLEPSVIVELGTRQAISTRIFAHASPSSKIYAVDPDPTCVNFVKGIPCELVSTTGEAFFDSRQTDFKMNFCFVDTDPHTYKQTLMWLDYIERFLAPGGCAAFHDIIENRPEIQVGRAVRDWVKQKPDWKWTEFQIPIRNYKWPQGGVGVLWRKA